jgi:hypothetical protein
MLGHSATLEIEAAGKITGPLAPEVLKGQECLHCCILRVGSSSQGALVCTRHPELFTGLLGHL